MNSNSGALGQIQQQSLRQTLSMQQVQYIALLQMNIPELNRYLAELYTENPVVDLEAPETAAPQPNAILDFARWISNYPERAGRNTAEPKNFDLLEAGVNPDGERDDLQAYLRSQFDFSLTDMDVSLLEWLLGLLDENGYLTETQQQIAARGLTPNWCARRLSICRRSTRRALRRTTGQSA
jgi:DNA-directed RNA polymerase specialized sigma54-like protein